MIYEYQDAPIERIVNAPLLSRPRGITARQKDRRYLNIISAFDIETSTLQIGTYPPIRKKDAPRPNLQAIMYVWMYHFSLPEEEITIIGHYWQEWRELIDRISDALPDNVYLVSYVHNLSFEWQFMRSWYPFDPDEIFAIKSRKILKCEMNQHIEYRCSYLHSNMSLDGYLKKWKVAHLKQSGELYDYKKIRYPWTPSTEYERTYQVNDVIGLCEALRAEMVSDGDSLYNIPLTSTGYVRRIIKTRMHKGYPRYKLLRTMPDAHLIELLIEGFRGGDTHANRYYAGEIVEGVESWDFSSSYPAWMLNRMFPVGRWEWVPDAYKTWDYLLQLLKLRMRAFIARVRIFGLRLKNKNWGCPYLTRDKGRNIVLPDGLTDWECYDNGRVMCASMYDCTLTDIDLRIVLEEYEFDSMEIIEAAHCRYGYLPDPIRETIREFYKNKTELKKDDPTDEEEIAYAKYKNLINAIYGMMVESPIKDNLKYKPDYSLEDGEDLFVPEGKTFDELTEDYRKRAFTSYAWGVWVTAWARYELHRGLWTIGAPYFLYCDTDSIKFLDPDGSRCKELRQHNIELRRDSVKNGGSAKDPAGKTHYLGIFERETPYAKFVTFGAKKYAYTYAGSDEVHITIAGVNKRKGAEELRRAGGIEALKEGFVFVDGGGTESIYNDSIEPIKWEAEGREILITSNVVIKESRYKFGLSSDYERLLSNLEVWLDITNRLVYHN